MDTFLMLLVPVGAIFALCLLGMAVGVIFRNRSFRSCGCSRITFRGQTIRCPGCTDPDGEEEGADRKQSDHPVETASSR